MRPKRSQTTRPVNAVSHHDTITNHSALSSIRNPKFPVSGLVPPFKAIKNPRNRNLATWVTLLFTFCSVTTPVTSERVYDCSTQTTAVATYSLDEVGECPLFEKTYKNKTLIRAQILQRSGSQLLEGFQCQLVIRREACYCSPLGNRKLFFQQRKNNIL